MLRSTVLRAWDSKFHKPTRTLTTFHLTLPFQKHRCSHSTPITPEVARFRHQCQYPNSSIRTSRCLNSKTTSQLVRLNLGPHNNYSSHDNPPPTNLARKAVSNWTSECLPWTKPWWCITNSKHPRPRTVPQWPHLQISTSNTISNPRDPSPTPIKTSLISQAPNLTPNRWGTPRPNFT